MNLTYMGEISNSTLQNNDLVLTGVYNNTAPIQANITGNVSAIAHVLGMDTLIGLETAQLMFTIFTFVVVSAYVVYQISDKRRSL